MKCGVCEGDYFTLDEGFQICTVCGTILEEFKDFDDETSFADLDASCLVRIKKEKLEKVKLEKNTTRIEVFNIVFHEWIKALCYLGASSRFEQIAFELWVLYIHRSGIAFLSEKTEEDSEEFKSAKTEENSEESKSSVLLNRRYSYSMCGTQVESSSVNPKVDFFKFKNEEYDPEHLNFPLLLSLLYLAVLLAEEPILLMDIIRWCREEHIPYLSAHNLLSQDCRHSVKMPDQVTSADEVKFYAESITLFLNILSLPMPPLKNVTDRIIKLLRLPELVGALALEHMKKIIESTENISVIGIEQCAMAAVIVVIKAYWGANDWDEFHLSHATTRINEEIGEGNKVTPLFCWLDWQRYINKLIWFCGEIDPVTRLYCQTSDGVVKGNVDSYAKFLWTKGVWQYSARQKDIKPRANSVIDKVLHAQNLSLTKLLNQPDVFKPTKEPFYSIIEQFIEAHGNEPQCDHQVKIGKELLEIGFAATSFNQPPLNTLQERIKKYGSSIKINSEVVTEQLQTSKPDIYVPQPLESVFKIPKIDRNTFMDKIWIEIPYESLKWLLDIGSLFCEASAPSLTAIVIAYENLYPK